MPALSGTYSERKLRATAFLRLLVGLGFMLACGEALAVPPFAGQPLTTDVTPASFAVTWVASEPTTPSLLLFQADCATPTTAQQAAETNDATGISRVMVYGLAAGTVYCYQTLTTSKVTGESTVSPLAPVPVITATTVTRVISLNGQPTPFANDLLRVPPVYLETQGSTQEGILISAFILDRPSLSPLSLLLTLDQSQNYMDMNNLFSATDGTTMNLSGAERVRIVENHGRSGCVIDRFRTVPADGELTKATSFLPPARPQDIDSNTRVNILDVLRVSAGQGTSQGDPCYNSDLDMNSDNTIDLQDLQGVEGAFDATP